MSTTFSNVWFHELSDKQRFAKDEALVASGQDQALQPEAPDANELGLGPEVGRVLDKCHNIRNLGEYEGLLDVDERKPPP
jgi:hypothetical protein